MKIRITLPVILLIGAIYGSCRENTVPVERPEKADAVFKLNEAVALIRMQTDQFTAAHISRDTAYLNNIFTEDARVFPPNSQKVVGRKAISELNADWVNYGIHEFVEKSTACYGNRDYIVDEGSYYLRYGDNYTEDKGKYINIWKYEGGSWKICSNIWNTDLPEE